MKANAEMTLFRHEIDPVTKNDIYTPHFMGAVMWQEIDAVTRADNGLNADDKVRVFIPMLNKSVIKSNDFVIKGNVNTFDKKTAYKVISVTKNDFGSTHLQHYEVILK